MNPPPTPASPPCARAPSGASAPAVQDTARAVGLMIGCSVLFATMATLVGLAHARDPGLSTLVTSAFRAGVNLVALVLLARFDVDLLLGDRRRALWIRGVLGGISLVCYFSALARLGVGVSAFLNQTSAIWVALLAPGLLGERTGRMVWVAVAGSLCGVALLAGPRAGEATEWTGHAFGLASGLTSAGAYLTVRKAGATNKPITIVFYFTLVAALSTTTASLVRREPVPHDPVVLGYLVGAGLAATFAQLIMTEAYRIGRAGPVAAAGAAGPLFSTLLGWAVLGQVPDRYGAVGMAILLVTGIGLPWLAAR